MTTQWCRLAAASRWDAAARAVGVAARVRTISTLVDDGAVVALHLRFEAGFCVEDLISKDGKLAAFYRCARVEVVPDRLRRDRCTVLLHTTLVPPRCLYPSQSQPALLPPSPYEPISLGMGDDGRLVSLPLFTADSGGTTVLIGGVPGAGKSMTMRAILAGVAQTTACVVAIDPTGGAEARRWGSRLSATVCSAEHEPTADLLADVLQLIKRRGVILGAGAPISLLPPLVLVCDELAELSAAGTPKQQEEARSMLRRIVALGRKANVACVLATQRTTSTSIDITTRSLASWRLALAHPDDHNGSEALLGSGHRQAALLQKADVGVGYLTNGGVPRLLRVFEVASESIADLADQPIARDLSELEWLDAVAFRELTL